MGARAQTADPSGGPRLAVIIDDLGYLRHEGLRALELPGRLTYGFLPHTPHGRELADLAFALGKEVMLHLPMESHHGRRLGPGGLTKLMDRGAVHETVRASLLAVPYVQGVVSKWVSVAS